MKSRLKVYPLCQPADIRYQDSTARPTRVLR